jgi:hypothetical protein
MATTNNITGDEIKSKALTASGRENYDKIFAKKSANEWLKSESVKILDPDGWRWDDGVTLDTPISYSEFQKRLVHCTVSGLIKS